MNAYRYHEQKCRLHDAEAQALRLLREHTPWTAQRVAAELALQFHPKSEGRKFWSAVLEILAAQGEQR